jgi:predicted RNase H-like nuclease (RuvC/YqgF family)
MTTQDLTAYAPTAETLIAELLRTVEQEVYQFSTTVLADQSRIESMRKDQEQLRYNLEYAEKRLEVNSQRLFDIRNKRDQLHTLLETLKYEQTFEIA